MLAFIQLLSGRAFQVLKDRNTVASSMRVLPKVCEDAMASRAYVVKDMTFRSSLEHEVVVINTVYLQPMSPKARETTSMINATLSKNTLDLNKCAICGGDEDSGDPEIGIHFSLPRNWKKLYQTRPSLVQLCRALGFKPPAEATGVSNSNILSLYSVIEEYQTQYNSCIKNGEGVLDSRRCARDYMAEFHFRGKTLGATTAKRGGWLYCGYKGDEEELPMEAQAKYCGGCIHLGCAGFTQMPRDAKADVRIGCIRCISDQKYRPKTPEVITLASRALHLPDGSPRITSLDHETDGIKTLLLQCSCGKQVGSGLPCEAMIAVGRVEGAVLSSRLVHKTWLSYKIAGATEAIPIFQETGNRMFNEKATVAKHPVHAAASALAPGQAPPKGPVVTASEDFDPALAIRVTQSVPGGEQQGEPQQLHVLAGVVLQGRQGDSSSRRKKSSKKYKP